MSTIDQAQIRESPPAKDLTTDPRRQNGHVAGQGQPAPRRYTVREHCAYNDNTDIRLTYHFPFAMVMMMIITYEDGAHL